MPRPYKPRVTNAEGERIAISYPRERPEPAIEEEGTSWHRGNRRKADSDESWYPPPQNVTRQKKLTKRRSRLYNKLPDTKSNSDSDESSSEAQPRQRKSNAKRVQKKEALKQAITPMSTLKAGCFVGKQQMKQSEDAPKGNSNAPSDEEIIGSSSDSMFTIFIPPDRSTSINKKFDSDSDVKSSEVQPRRNKPKAISVQKGGTREKEIKPTPTSESKGSLGLQPMNRSTDATKGVILAESDEISRRSNCESDSEKQMTDDGSSSSLFSIYNPPARNTSVESPTVSENEMRSVIEPMISTYVAPAQQIDDASLSASDYSEQMRREPLISTYYPPTQHSIVASCSESDSEVNVNDEPLISTYSAPAATTSVEVSSSEFESEVDMNNGPIITTYVPRDRYKKVGSSEDKDRVYDGPIVSTWVPPAGETESDSDSHSDSSDVSGPMTSTSKVKRKHGKILSKTKAQTKRPVFTNKAVKRLEAKGKTAAIKVPKRKLNTKYKERSPKPKRIRVTNKPKTELPCPICERVFSNVSNLKRHIRDFHEGDPVQCAVCGIKLSCKRGWEQHQMIFHNKDHQDVHCEHCGKAFASKSAKSMHLLRVCPQSPKPTI